MKKQEMTLIPAGDRWAIIFKASKRWAYVLADGRIDYKLDSLPYLPGCCIGADTKKEAKEQALFHAAQNVMLSDNLTSFNKALEICPKSKVDELRYLWQWQNRAQAWLRFGYDNNQSHRKACDNEFPEREEYRYSQLFHGDCVITER